MPAGIHASYENLRLLLARILYGWACLLARQPLRDPWQADAPAEFERLQAERMARAAEEWKRKYTQLRDKLIERAAQKRVEF